MTTRIPIIAVAILMACKAPSSEEARDSVAVDSTEYWQANDEPPEDVDYATSSEVGHTGIIVEDNVPIWSDTSRSEEYITMVNKGDRVILLNEYPGLVNPWITEYTPFCDKMGYHFYDVKVIQDNQEIRGVLYGDKVFIHPTGYYAFRGVSPKVMEDQLFEINGEQYEFSVAVSDGIGPSDENGLTGCDDTYIPYFRHTNTDRISFIDVPDESLLKHGDSHMSALNGFLRLVWGSEGGECQIKSIDQGKCNGEWSLVLNLESGYQDGGATFTMCVTHQDGNFKLLTVYKN